MPASQKTLKSPSSSAAPAPRPRQRCQRDRGRSGHPSIDATTSLLLVPRVTTTTTTTTMRSPDTRPPATGRASTFSSTLAACPSARLPVVSAVAVAARASGPGGGATSGEALSKVPQVPGVYVRAHRSWRPLAQDRRPYLETLRCSFWAATPFPRKGLRW